MNNNGFHLIGLVVFGAFIICTAQINRQEEKMKNLIVKYDRISSLGDKKTSACFYENYSGTLTQSIRNKTIFVRKRFAERNKINYR
jgi:hypothetical protein